MLTQGDSEGEFTRVFFGFDLEGRDFDFLEFSFEVIRELGLPFVLECLPVSCEEIERLVAIAQPPLAITRLEQKALRLENSA